MGLDFVGCTVRTVKGKAVRTAHPTSFIGFAFLWI